MHSISPRILSDDTLTLEAVDRQLATGFPLLKFEPALEQRYDADNWVERTRYLILTAVVSLFLYDCFLISDWQMLPDVFTEACIIRLGIFSPYVLISIWFASRTRSPVVRELLASVAPVVSMILIAIFYLKSTSSYRPHYNHGMVLIMIFASVVQRIRFLYAVIANTGMFAIQLGILVRSGAFDAEMIRSDIVFFAASVILLLSANYALEREHRRGYLLTLRSGLLNERLDRSAKVDPLTNLWNRRYLTSIMDRDWADALASPRSMAAILFDIDHFKLFNDTYGHLEGDLCLQRISRCIGDVVRDDGAAAVRFGGEEFLIFVRDFDEVKALAMAERLRAAVHREAVAHPCLGANAIITASFGVAVGVAPLVSPSGLIAAADRALYQAKAEGRDRVRATNQLVKGVIPPRYAGAA